MTDQIVKLEKVAFHRNGVCGTGFTIGISKCHVDGDPNEKRNMLIVQFDPQNCSKDLMQTAVLDLDLLKKEIIAFGENSWRGDRFATEFSEKSSTMLADQFHQWEKAQAEKIKKQHKEAKESS